MEFILNIIVLNFMLLILILKIKHIIKVKLFLLMIFSLIIFLGSIIYLWINKSNVVLKLKGSSQIELRLNEEYKELGVIAKVDSTDFSDNVIIKWKVDITKVGKYEIIYQLNYKNKKYKVNRIINVIDDENPVITFDEELEYICPDYNSINYNVHAIDNYDGDITNKIDIKEEKINDDIFKVTFTVSDSSGNRVKKIKEYLIKDEINPEITLNQGDIHIIIGNNYREPGFSALDNCSGDITDNVVIKGDVDINREGIYGLTYEVKDDYNNMTSVTRMVYVLNLDDTTNKIYLTFDDGPSSLTPLILDILKDEGVSATFFIIDFSKDKDYIVKRIVDEGHTIAIHGMSHVYQDIYCSEEAYMNNIDSLQNKIEQITGVKTWITRFPGGSSNMISSFNPGIMTKLTKLVIENGYHYFDWNVDSNDAGGAYISSKVYDNVITNLRHDRINVVLMHDAGSKKQTLGALRDIIKYGKQNGYVFDKITMETPLVIHSVNN